MHDRKGKDWKGQAAPPLDQKQKTIGIKKMNLKNVNIKEPDSKDTYGGKYTLYCPIKVHLYISSFR